MSSNNSRTVAAGSPHQQRNQGSESWQPGLRGRTAVPTMCCSDGNCVRSRAAASASWSKLAWAPDANRIATWTTQPRWALSRC